MLLLFKTAQLQDPFSECVCCNPRSTSRQVCRICIQMMKLLDTTITMSTPLWCSCQCYLEVAKVYVLCMLFTTAFPQLQITLPS